MVHLLQALGVLVALLMSQGATADRLRLVGDAWPPFTDATMVNGGLATELVTTALARAGYISEFQQVPWTRALLGLGEGRYDIIVNAWYSEDRTRIGQFSAGYLMNRVVFLRPKGSEVLYRGDYTELHPYSIAVVRGYSYAAGFDGDEKLHKVPVQNFPLAARMLVAKRVQLTLEDEMVARYHLLRESPRVRANIEFLPVPLSENRLRILVSLKHPDHEKIVADFDREMAAMKADGTYDRLLQRSGL